MKTVTIYTDGACSGNPGPGGWGAILMYGEHKKELSGGEPNTTNNRMELTAVIQALSCLKQPCIVELWSDSKYIIDALEKRLGRWLAETGLGEVRQKARPESGSLGAASGPAGSPRPPLPLGEGPRRKRLQQPLRRAGRGGEPEVQIIIHKLFTSNS